MSCSTAKCKSADCEYIYIYLYLCKFIHTHIYIYMCMYKYIYICMYVCMCMYVCVRMYVYIYIYIYISKCELYNGSQKELLTCGADSNLVCSRWDQPLRSSSGIGSKDTVTMFNLHFYLIFRCSLRAIWLAFLTMILSFLFVVFLFSSRVLQISNTYSKSRLLQNIADTSLATAHLISSLPLWVTFLPFSRLILGLRPMILHDGWNSCFINN